MSFIIRNGIKSIQKSDTSIFTRKSIIGGAFFGQSNEIDFRRIGKSLRASCIAGAQEYLSTKTHLNKDTDLYSNLSKNIIDGLSSPFEKQLNLVEQKNSDIMNSYYNLLRNENSKQLGVFVFLGFDNEYNFSYKEVVQGLMGIDAFEDIDRIKKTFYIHCRRNKDSANSFEFQNADGSRNFKKIFDFDSIKSKIGIINEKKGVTYMDIIFESPNVDNAIFVLTPNFSHRLAKRNENEVVRQQIVKAIIQRCPKPIFVPVISGLKPFRYSDNETSICSDYDQYATSTIGILTDCDNFEIERSLYIPEGWIKISDKKDLSLKLIDIKNRMYKFFFRENTLYLKNLITNTSKKSKELLDFIDSIKTSQPLSEKFLLGFLSDWDLRSMSLKLFLSQRIERNIFSVLINNMGELNMDEMDFSKLLKSEKEKSLVEIYNEFHLILKDESLDQNEFANLKSQWLYFSETLRGNELPNHFVQTYSKQFIDSIVNTPEVRGAYSSDYPNLFQISWNRNYKLALFSLLNDDFVFNIQNKIIEDTVEGIDKFSVTEKDTSMAVYCLKYVAFNFGRQLSDDYYQALISKEFTPSITFEEFRESVNEVFTALDYKEQELLGFSTLWNYIYLKAVSKKLSRDIVNASMGSLVNQLLFESYNFFIFKNPSQDLFGSILELLKSTETLKNSLGFKPVDNKKV
ncbi:hypothetical protein RB653_001138 [Dictyostelium firmibasis]|uniref:Uncharacterized protein n=1 Tax=Dictyostelium firmibasis TaxID=79012 RepID=A0AAN7U3T7_9MYCE